MKLLVRQHLQGMKERGGLDALVPQLLSESGYEVIHHPRVGGRQAGVDVAAVGPDPDANGEQTLCLFVIKSGDVGRDDWNGSVQAVRQSLEEILDDYIPNRVSPQHRTLPISVCVCMGGEIQEGVRSGWKGFQEKNARDGLRFREWNGDRLANFILSGILNRELLDPGHRAEFQKAIALVSEPEESYLNFRALLQALSKDLDPGKSGTTRLRQMLICLWILVGNGLDAENFEAPYRACELALLHVWDAYRRCPERSKARRAERIEIFNQVLSLYLTVSQTLLVEKIGPNADRLHALSASVRSRSALDINLSLFETVGRMALLGHWCHYFACRSEGDGQAAHLEQRDQLLNLAISVINNNPTLLAPIRDDHHIEIGLFMLLAQFCGRLNDVDDYFRMVAVRMAYRYGRRLHWPTWLRDYRQLARHHIDRSDAYFRRSTIGSVMVPFMIVGLERLGATDELAEMGDVVNKKLAHMTQQVWVPHEETDGAMWRDGDSSGITVPVPALKSDEGNSSLSDEVADIASQHGALWMCEALQRGMFPLFFMACRHHRLPLPPHFWFGSTERDGGRSHQSGEGTTETEVRAADA